MEIDQLDYAWLNLTPEDCKTLQTAKSPFVYDMHNPGLNEVRLMRNSDYFYFAAKTLLNIELLPIQLAILEELWHRPFPMYIASRGFGKSFMLAVLAWMKLILVPGTKVVIVGAAFRQSKIVFEYMKTIWENSSVLQSIADGNSGPRVETDKLTMKFNSGWACALPMGDGQKIRGMRAHLIIADEFASISPEIYETVVQGFTSVSASPIQNVQTEARKRKFKDLGLWKDEYEELMGSPAANQSILSGTADYAFKHFAKYWKRYHTIITSGGNEDKLMEAFPDGNIPDGFSWRDYSIIRIPYELVPKGFMDEKQIAKARATIHSGTFNNEYGACFSEDSDGFFKRSLIESCVVSKQNPINGIVFDPRTTGDRNLQYIYGVDPASEQDNFTIVILEAHPNHNRVVYCWSTTRKEFKKKVQAGTVKEHDFYGYCCRKIRNLMKVFPCVKIALDSQGGGVAIQEALQDPDKIHANEQPIYPIVNIDKPQYSDTMMGLHIVELINFADAKWTSSANHGMKKDMEDKILLLPSLDPVLLAIESERDSVFENNRQSYDSDSFEDCALEIEELKNELCTIIHSMTGSGGQGSRERWDTPEIKSETGKKGRLRKDRYSSLVMANMVARQLARAIEPVSFEFIADAGRDVQKDTYSNKSMYRGTDMWRNVTDECFIGINRQR